MVFNPTSPIRNFQVKQKAAEITKPTVGTNEATRSKTEMSSFEQTPAAVALEENKIIEKVAPSVETSNKAAASAESKPIDDKSLPSSPVVSSGFSDVETVKVDRDSNVSDLSTRSRQGWAGSVKRLIGRSSSLLHSDKKLSKQKPQKVPLKVSDPIAIPAPLQLNKARPTSKSTTNSSPVDPAYDPVKKRFRSSETGAADLLPAPVTKPDEPRSFLDLDSSSDEDSPIVQRASSVRVGRPQIVRHTSKSAKQASQYAESKGTNSPSLEKAEKVLGEPLVNLYDLSAASQNHEDVATASRADALAILEGKAEDKQGDSTLVPSPKAEDIKSTTIVVSDHPDNAESHDVYVSPHGGLSSIRASIVPTDTVPELPIKTALDGLRSNPISETEKSLLSRTISAPPLPNRNPNRRVTIRPSDLVIHHPDHDHKLFRESIITTPYPPNVKSPTRETGEKIEDFRTPIGGRRPTVSLVPLPPQSSRTDRFPSPTIADESLFLTLTLSRNPAAAITIEIIIPSAEAPTFDDSDLFKAIRSSYNIKLLGLTRRAFCSRTLSHVTPGTSDMNLDSTDFVAQLLSPKRGCLKKRWLMWLRNQQPLPKRASSLFSSTQSPIESAHPSMAFSHSHSNSMNGGHGTPNTTSVPRMPFMRAAGRDLPPAIHLHYRFNVLHIAMATLMVLLMSVMSTVLWVLFGYPGLHAGDSPVGAQLGPTVPMGETWQGDAQMRVLTGLVLGLAVMLLGGTGVVAWVAAGWVLL